MSQIMDEALIDEVAHHGVIFNRQKYYLNGGGPGGGSGGGNKYETKDEAWQTIAMKLRTDVETCKKRWKYLRERYVSQRKQCDPPVYEHLSRPYLEKMKFLDQHIQPRKSYRNVPSFLTSPHSANSSNYGEYNMDSKSNSSLKSLNPFGSGSSQSYHHHHHHHSAQEQAQAMNALTTAAAALEGSSNGSVKIEADVFRDFAAAVASQQLQISQSQMHHHHHPHHQQHQQVAAVAAAMAADSSQNFQDHFREGNGLANGATAGVTNGTAGGIPSSSSSMKSPLSSPLHATNGQNGSGQSSSSTPQQVAAHSSTSQMGHGFNGCQNGGDLDGDNNNGFHAKKARLQSAIQMPNGNGANTSNASNASNNHYTDDTDDESDDNSSGGNNNNNIMHPQTILHEPQFDNSATTTNQQRNSSTGNGNNVSSGSNNNHNLNSNNNNHSSQQHNMFPANAANDFLFQLYQTLPHQQQGGRSSNHDSHQQQQPQQQQNHHSHHQFGKASASSPLGPPAGQHAPQRSSEQLLGELVTTELLKMHGDKRKQVQKRILEILFFDD